MKHTAYLKLLPVALILVISSCREDTVTNPPTSNVIYTLDSLSAWIDPGYTGTQYSTNTFGQTVSASKVKLEFTLQSNADSVHAIGSFKDSTNGSPSLPGERFVYLPVDSAFTYTINVTTQPFYLWFEARIRVWASGSIPFYLRLKNIKVTRI